MGDAVPLPGVAFWAARDSSDRDSVLSTSCKTMQGPKLPERQYKANKTPFH